VDGKEHTYGRSDARERRRWLRFLDPVLTDEIRDAGAVSREELMEMAVRPLEGLASRTTIDEWWEYAHRRSWLEEHGADRCRLTRTGRKDLRVRRESVDGPDLAEWAKTLAGWTLAGGAIGAASYLSGKSGELWIAIVAVCLIAALLLFVASPVARAIDRPMDRWLARRACDCLDGRRAGWWRRGDPAVDGGVRRLYEGDGPDAPVAT
jgi:hypothetical protein